MTTNGKITFSDKMKIYFASPLGFSESTILFMQKIENKIEKMGYTVINPWKLTDPNIIKKVEQIRNFEEKIKRLHTVNLAIAKTNKNAIDSCDLIFAVLNGVDVDSGTASEIGYGFGVGKKIIGYRSDFRKSGDNYGAIVNLQVQYWIEESGGKIIKSIDEITKALFLDE